MKSTFYCRTTFAILVAITALVLFGGVSAFAVPPVCDTTAGSPKLIETKQTEGGDSATGGEFQCDAAHPNEWHFVITQVESQSACPLSISLVWQDNICSVTSLSLAKFTGGTCHYGFTSLDEDDPCLTATLLSATASIYLNWATSSCGNGQFNVSHAPCGEETPPPPPGDISACKFYDFNTDGTQSGVNEVDLNGWPMTLSPSGGTDPATQSTTAPDGCVTWHNLDPSQNPYTVTEGTPPETNWVASTQIAQIADVGDAALEFGNYCTVPSGGKTPGFWSNKNGEALFTSPADLTSLADNLNLRDATGANFNPASYAAFKTWLLNAEATNMAYKLSSHLAAMKLNVSHGLVDGGAFALCASQTINDLMNTANTSLGNDGLTPAGDPNRATQEALKNCLDALNRGLFCAWI